MKKTTPNSKITDENILKNMNRLEYALNCIETGAWELDLVTKKIWCSMQQDKIFGYSEPLKEWNYDIFIKHVIPEDREMVNERFKEAVSTKTDWIIECRIMRKDGCTRWIMSKGSHEVINNQKPTKMFGMVQDISEKKISQEKIQDSEQKYKALYENAPLSYQSLNDDGTFKDINPRWLQTLGYERNEVIGKKYADFLHPEWQEHFEKNFPAFKKRGYVNNVQFKLRHKKGHYIDISFNGCIGYNADGSFRQTYCVFQDITAQLDAEKKLKISEERFRLLYNNSPDMHASISPVDSKILMCNDTLLNKLGYTREEVIGVSIFKFYHNDCLEYAKEVFQQSLKTSEINNCELTLKRKEGSKIEVSLSVHGVRDEAGSILYSTSSWRDITERKLNEKRIRTAEVNLQKTFNLSPSIICKANLRTGYFIEANQAVTRILGYSVKEFTSKPFLDFIHLDDQQKSADEKIEQINGKEVTSFENRYLCKNGSYKWIAWHGTKPDEDGIVTAIGTDITEKKRAEIEVIETAHKYRKAQAMGHVGNWEYNIETSSFWASEEAKKIYGFELDSPEFTAEEVEKCIPERNRVHQALIDLIEKKQTYDLQFEIISKDKGQIKTLHSIAQLDNDSDGKNIRVSGVVSDITPLIKKTEDLIKSERKFMAIFDQSPVAIEIYDKNGLLIDTNQQTLNMFGLDDKKYVLGFNLWNDPNLSSESMVDLKRGKPIYISTEFDFGVVKRENLYPTSRSGTMFMDMYAIPMVQNNEISGYLVQIIEVTERKKAQESLIKFKTAIEKSEVTILITNDKGLIEYANPYFTKLTGYTMDETMGKNPSFLKTEFHPKKFYEDMWCTINSGKTWEGEFCNQKKNGDLYWEKAIITPLQNEKNIISNYVAIKTDISEDKKIEEQLRQSQKMEAIGQLAGGVAHDFNNMLTGIMGCTELISSQVIDDQELSQYTHLIMDTAMQAAELTKKLLSFSHKEKSDHKVFDIHESISKTCSMLERSIDKTILIKTDFKAINSKVNGDKSLIENSLLNLGINARDVMPKGGELTFITSDVEFNESNKNPNLSIANGQYIEIDVQDTGSGMTKEVQNRLFEPFFTTKKMGKGTGLGLSIVYNTIKESNGFVHIYSEIGYGSIFKIFLPIITDKPIFKESVDQELLLGKGTILVVDDEKIVRLVISQMLSELGYQVIVAEEGEDCLNIYKDKSSNIDLVILDLVMPKMNGKDVFYGLKAIDPDVKVLICSGFSMDISIEKLIQDGLSGFMQKPYKKLDLSLKVGGILSQ